MPLARHVPGPSVVRYRERIRLDAFFTTTSGIPFRWERWRVDEARTLPWRSPMLYDLLHSYRLIGMERAVTHQFLGPPNFPRCADPESPSLFDTEWYLITDAARSFCANSAQDTLEIAYKNERVVAVRCVSAAFR